MEKLVIKLKQHTPLIHFQHDQDGATLRASEVKPKLDRFILSKLGDGNYEAGVQIAKKNGWLVGNGDHPSLNYKMRIVSSGEKEEYLLASSLNDSDVSTLNSKGIKSLGNTSYFAQEKQNTKIIKGQLKWNDIDKKGLIEKGDISMSILFTDIKMSKFISEIIQSFFICTNFGTRQSKGFGCFIPTLIELNDKPVQLINNETFLKQNFVFVYKKKIINSSISNILSTINNDYKLLKSGLTRPYAKSKLMLYASSLDSDTGWDKKYIKVYTNDSFESENGDNYLLKCKPENEYDSYSEKERYLYYRALLGLAEQFEFLLENPPLGNRKNKMIVKVENDEIKRYQSPILFKVIGNTIYLVGNEIAKGMLGKPFFFLVNFQKDNGYEDVPVNESGEPIYTPSSFSLRNFISFAMKDHKLGYEGIKK